MKSIAIAGVGLIGGSFGLALRQAGFDGRILGISRPETIRIAVEAGAVDEGVTLEQAAAEADAIFLAQPVAAIIESVKRLAAMVRPECLITDAGSTKAEIVRAASGVPLFLGGHPMAGKESRGVASATPDLFRNRTWVFTPRPGEAVVHPLACEFVKWVSRCGAVPFFSAPDEHDHVVAFTSHLPQLASTGLAIAVGSEIHETAKFAISGPALRDQTRLALSSWEVWSDIVATNAGNIEHALSVYIDILTDLRDNLQTQDTGEDFRLAADVAGRLRQRSTSSTEEG